jgi:hypothetical protein
MSESTVPAERSASERPVLVRGPALIAVLLLAAGVAATLITGDLDIVQFLLLLGGGWCAGFAFVNAVEQMPRNGLVLHLATAIVLAGVLVTVIEAGSALIAPLPEMVRGALVSLNLAAIPAAGWIWLGLLDRATRRLRRREAARTPPRLVPEWERDTGGDGSIVAFTAVAMRLSELTRTIVWIVVVVGVLGVAALILLDDIVMHLGVRLSIILVGAGLGLPVYTILTARLRRRSVPCTVAFGNDEVRISVDGTASVVSYDDLEHLLWRRKSDYARVEVRGAGVELSLVVGIAKPRPGAAPELPPLPRRMARRFELFGLVPVRQRRDDVTLFRRTGGSGSDG